MEVFGHGFGCGPGGVNDGEGMVEGGEDAVDGWLKEWVVGAAEEEGLGVRSFDEGFFQVDFQDFVGDGVVDPAFFYQWDEKRAGFFVGFEVEGCEGSGVGMGLDGGLGGEDEDVGERIRLLWHVTHLSDDETVANLGHPALWRVSRLRLRSRFLHPPSTSLGVRSK